MKLITTPTVVEVVDHVSTGREVRVLRQRYGITLQQVSDHSGLSKAYLSNLEHGERSWYQDLLDQIIEAIEKARNR